MLFLIFAILVIISGRYFRLNPSWDMGHVLNSAIEYVETKNYTGTYLSRCTNNIMMTYIESVIFKFLSIFGVITLVNSIIIILTIIISFYIVKKIFGRKQAVLYMCICCITTPLYLYTSVYYTDVWSMFITVVLLGGWLLIQDTNKKTNKIVLEIVYGILLFVGIKLKTTSIFIFVAIVLCSFLQNNYKRVYKDIIIALITTLICCLVYNFTIINIFTTEENRTRWQLPFEHYFMMGMQKRGGYNEEANKYTDSFKTYEEKKNANRNRIKELLRQRDVSTHLKFLESKLGYTWHDGTYFVPEKLRRNPVEKGIWHEFILVEGKYNKYYKYFPQVMHYSMLALIMCNLFRKIKKKQYYEKDTILLVTIFGFLIFLMFWETRSRYLVTILPIMIICQINGIEYLLEIYENRKIKKALCEKNYIINYK